MAIEEREGENDRKTKDDNGRPTEINPFNNNCVDVISDQINGQGE
jgi:hypothetical protein